MSEMIDTGNPVNRDAQTFEHNAEDLRTIEELKDRAGMLSSKLKNMADDRARISEESESLRSSVHELKIKLERSEAERSCLIAECKELRCCLEDAKYENVALRNKLESVASKNDLIRKEREYELNRFVDSINIKMAEMDSEIKELRRIVDMETEG